MPPSLPPDARSQYFREAAALIRQHETALEEEGRRYGLSANPDEWAKGPMTELLVLGMERAAQLLLAQVKKNAESSP